MEEILTSDIRTLHPLWEQYKIPDQKQYYIYFNPYSGQVSTTFPRAQAYCRGGILADEMGLGKTVMMISLIHSNKKRTHDYIPDIKPPNDEIEESKNDTADNFIKAKNISNQPSLKSMLGNSKRIKEAATLIVLPVTLLAQWEEEIKNHSLPNQITYYVYYGNSKNATVNLAQYDVVLTTYGTMSSEFASASN